MKRIALTAIFVISACLMALARPDMVSVMSLMVTIIVGLVVVIISLIAYPVTEYITKEKIVEVPIPNSFRYGIGQFRDVEAEFTMESGEKIYGKLVGRNDRYGTFTIRRNRDFQDETVPQASLKRVSTVCDDTPESALAWDDTSELLVPRTCN